MPAVSDRFTDSDSAGPPQATSAAALAVAMATAATALRTRIERARVMTVPEGSVDSVFKAHLQLVMAAGLVPVVVRCFEYLSWLGLLRTRS
jgi:hypothetical protein